MTWRNAPRHKTDENCLRQEDFVKLTQRNPVFLTLHWDGPEGRSDGTVTLEATLCHAHRQEIARMHPSARGCGKLGESCDFCEGRETRRR